MRLRAWHDQPITEIIIWILIEIDDVRGAAVNRKVARPRCTDISDARRGPAEQVLWQKIINRVAKPRSKADDLVHLMFGKPLCIQVTRVDRSGELKWRRRRRIKSYNSIIRTAWSDSAVCKHARRCVQCYGTTV